MLLITVIILESAEFYLENFSQDSELDTDSVVPSVIYKWTTDEDGKQSFTERTSVDVSHATSVAVLEIRNDVYVLFSSYDFLEDEITTDYADRIEVFKVL